MHQPWPVIERRAEAQAIAEATGCATGPWGVIVDGVSGAGKTTLLSEFLKSCVGPTTWLAGNATTSSTPFGAFSRVIDSPDAWDVAVTLSKICRTVTDGNRDGTVVVDDAHLLDPLSADILNQIATTHTLSLVITLQTGNPVPEAISALWKDRGFSRVTLGCFNLDEIDTVLVAALGGPVDSKTSVRIAAASEGNPRFLRHLVEGSLADGRLICCNGIWQLRGEPTITEECALHLRHLCAAVPAAAERALAVVAFGEPLDVAVLEALTSTESMLAVECTGLVRFGTEGGIVVARLAQPFLGEVVRQQVDGAEARRIRGELATLLGADAREPLTRIRAAALSIGTNHHRSPQSLTAAAADATALCSFASAEELARAASAEGAGFRAQLLRAGALAWTDRGGEAEQVLASLDPVNRPESDYTRWAVLRAGNLFWNLDALPSAYRILRTAYAHVTSPAGRHCVEAARAAIDVSAGRVVAATKAAARVRHAPNAPSAAKMWAASASCMGLAMMGLGDEAASLADESLPLTQPDTAVLRFSIGHGHITALIYTGRFTEAELAADRYLELARHHDAAWFGISSLVGKLSLTRGRIGDAHKRLSEAAAVLDTSSPERRVVTNLLLARVLAVSGQTQEAVGALEQAETSLGEHRHLYRSDVVISRAWISAASGNLGRAIGLARRAAADAEEAGLLAVAAEAAHTAVRFGDSASVVQLRALSTAIDGLLIGPMVDHASALADSDGDGLLAAARKFESLGAYLLAADAYAHAAGAYRHVGNRRDELRASTRAYALAQKCDDAWTPAIFASAAPFPLTPRERAVAALAAGELTNKEIAHRLGVSARTVEGHVYHVLMKLDVRDREEMAETVAMGTCR
jgi:DNA-binding CsgD family transcriptional regulator